jgi:hypothetical protein
MNQASQGRSATTGSTRPGSEQHPPTAAMNSAVEGRATSPQDVRSQTAGQPTAAEQAQGRRSPVAGDAPAASAALSRARILDQQGDETNCMDAVDEAKRQLTGR